MHVVGFMSFGFTEVLVVGTVALLVFGGDLPDVMRKLGNAYGKFRQGLHDMSKPVREEIQRVKSDLPNPVDSVRSAAAEANVSLDDPVPSAAAERTPDPAPYDVGTDASSDLAWDDLDEPPPV